MDDLADFLLARIAEDEAEARRGAGWSDRTTRWGRVLADCEAKRRIVEAEAGRRVLRDEVGDVAVHTWSDKGSFVSVNGEQMTTAEFDAVFTEPAPPSGTLRLIALPYADHPDYREQWRP